MSIQIDERVDGDELMQLYRWDEYRVDDASFFLGVLMEHHTRNRRTYHRLDVDVGGARTFFPENGDDEREHSVFVTAHGDVYSRLLTRADADPDEEAGRHRKIVQNKFDALHGRATAAEKMVKFLNTFPDDVQDDVFHVLTTGPYKDAETLYTELQGVVPDLDTASHRERRERYGNVTDTEGFTNGRNATDYHSETAYGEEMQEIYHNVLDVVASQR